MILGTDLGVVAVLAFVLVVGAAVQGLVGLGLGLVAAPVVTILDPALMPELMLVLAALLPLLTLDPFTRRHRLARPGLAAPGPCAGHGGRRGVPGVPSPTATWASPWDSMVLVAVVLSLTRVSVPVRPATLVAAGLVSGAAGTATSIGGPPVALLYQHRSSTQIRSTLAVMFTLGSAVSLVGLWLGGRFEERVLFLALLLTPCLAVGALLGIWVHGVVPDRGVRYGVLAVCAASAMVLLVRSLTGWGT